MSEGKAKYAVAVEACKDMNAVLAKIDNEAQGQYIGSIAALIRKEAILIGLKSNVDEKNQRENQPHVPAK